MFQLFYNEMYVQQFFVAKSFTWYNIYGSRNALKILNSNTGFQKFSFNFITKINLSKSFILYTIDVGIW
jgi:hypothetical protein